MKARSYVLVSACRNEGDYLDGLIECIAAQTLPPLRWIIVDDGSTDDTQAKAELWGKFLPFLTVVRMPAGRPRNFSSQAHAAQFGCEQMAGLPYEFIGFLDADIRLGPDYYKKLTSYFAEDPRLGLGAGALIDQYPDRQENVRAGSEDFHVPGGVQFFRRACFEQIGGYRPIDGGGQDTVADVMAQMHGWKIRSFAQLTGLHLRPDGVGNEGVLKRGMKWGRKFYLIGYHPLFYFGQCLRRLGRRPVVLGGLCQFVGFVCACLRRESRPVSHEFVRFLRQMQMQRLRTMIRHPAEIMLSLSDTMSRQQIRDLGQLPGSGAKRI